MKKLEAFTLVEVIVAMIVSLIVAGITVMSYQIINKRQEQFKHMNDSYLFTNDLHAILMSDFVNAVSIHRNDETICFVNQSSQPISYSFSSTFIVRAFESVQDTFFVEPQNIVSSFQKVENAGRNGIIDRLKFQTTIPGLPLTFEFAKCYDASVLLKESENSGGNNGWN